MPTLSSQKMKWMFKSVLAQEISSHRYLLRQVQFIVLSEIMQHVCGKRSGQDV